MTYEYKVVPAPVRGVKAKGIKTPQDRFAHALELAMNELAADGWEYLRADTLPSEQRDGLLSKSTAYQNMLVFRRAKKAKAPAKTTPRPQLEAPRPEIAQAAVAQPKPVVAQTTTDEATTPSPPVRKPEAVPE